MRHLLSWKSLFYDALLPVLRRLGPVRADAILGALGGGIGAWPARRRELEQAIEHARQALAADWDSRAIRTRLAANTTRFLARDYLLDGISDAKLASRFDVQGFDYVRRALARGRGVVLVGSHLGAHLAALHWLSRSGIPLRLLVQRPKHVSGTLQSWFDRSDEAYPQAELFLRRDLPTIEAAQRILRARAALRDGAAVYLSGDIPWDSCNARPARLLGRERPFLAVWAELAILARAPAICVFCTHLPGGRYALRFDAPWHFEPGEEAVAVYRYVARLELEIAAEPAEAVAHLTWPCYARSNNRPCSLASDRSAARAR